MHVSCARLCRLLLRCGVVIALCLLTLCPTVAAGHHHRSLQQLHSSTASTDKQQLHPAAGALRVLTTSVSLYCNKTGGCRPCKPEHMQAEACKQTEHAEKLTCVTDSTSLYQTVLKVHRQINTAVQPLHVSRSCQAPASAATGAAAAKPSTSTTTPPPSAGSATTPLAAAGSGLTQHASTADADDTTTPGPASSSSSSDSSSIEDDGGSTTVVQGGGSRPPHPRQVYFEGGGGGLNVLYFELMMMLVLSGALPVMILRKRRYVRL